MTDRRTDGQTDGRTNGPTDGPTKQVVESRSTRLKKGRMHGNPVADSWGGAVKQKALAIQK